MPKPEEKRVHPLGKAKKVKKVKKTHEETTEIELENGANVDSEGEVIVPVE